MANGDIHTVPHGDDWANRVAAGERVSNTAPTMADAERRGRDMARERGVKQLIHNNL